jgi:hypothetical protein
MKRFLIYTLLVASLIASASAQDTFYSIFSFNGFTPKVGLNDRSTDLQSSLFPRFYRTRSTRADMRWLAENDGQLTTFWRDKGDSVLHILRELSGIEWYESEFDIYLVRFYPTLGSADPTIIPLGGMGDGTSFEVAPDGNRLILNLLFQLSRRMLAQAVQPEDSVILGIAYHPLMQPGPYRQDNLAMLLAIATAQSIIGYDSTMDAWASAFWKHHTPGRKILEKHLLNQWILSPDRPLADWIASESYSSTLVRLTRPPKPVRRGSGAKRQPFVEGLPFKGELGFSIKFDESDRMVVNRIDVNRLAFANGLREGDRLHRVDGRRVKSHRELVERLLAGLEAGGTLLEIIRDEKTETLLMQPMKPLDESDYYYLDAYDELGIDTSGRAPDEDE